MKTHEPESFNVAILRIFIAKKDLPLYLQRRHGMIVTSQGKKREDRDMAS